MRQFKHYYTGIFSFVLETKEDEDTVQWLEVSSDVTIGSKYNFSPSNDVITRTVLQKFDDL